MTLLITLLGVALGTGIWLYVLRRYDRVEPEEVRYLVRVGVVGGGASLVSAVVLNGWVGGHFGIYLDTLGQADLTLGQMVSLTLATGTVEETTKLLAAIVATRWLGDYDEPVDGMIYAMTTALGFAAFENLLYAYTYGNSLLVTRFLWPVPAHMAYAAVWGYGLVRARYASARRPGWLVVLPYLAAAAVLHGAANLGLLYGTTPTVVASLGVLVGLGVLAHVRLHRLVANSPFLKPGICAECQAVNDPHAAVCFACEADLAGDDIFAPCPCGRFRIPAEARLCTRCGRDTDDYQPYDPDT